MHSSASSTLPRGLRAVLLGTLYALAPSGGFLVGSVGFEKFSGPSSLPVTVAAVILLFLPLGAAWIARDPRPTFVRTVVALPLVFGLAVATVRTLELPLRPAASGFATAVAVLVAGLAWCVGAPLGHALSDYARDLAFLRSRAAVIGVLAIAVGPLVVASLRTPKRPSPDEYWASLEPRRTVYEGKVPSDLRQCFPQEHVDDDCTYVVESNCVILSTRPAGALPSTWGQCPPLEVRRDPDGAHTTVARTSLSGIRHLFWGLEVVYVVGPATVTRGQTPLLSASIVGGEVRVPLAWTALALCGFVISACAMLWRQGRAVKDGTSLFVLLVTMTPMLVSVAMGVGR